VPRKTPSTRGRELPPVADKTRDNEHGRCDKQVEDMGGGQFHEILNPWLHFRKGKGNWMG